MLTALLLTAALSPEPAPLFGPPALCHPVHIGEARSLPWTGPGGFDVDRSYDLDALAADTVAILVASDDVLVHMETVRRAAVYVFRTRDDGDRGPELARELVAALKGALAAQTAKKEHDARTAGLRWFDVGYALGVLRQAGHELEDGGRRALDRAAQLLPGDAAVFLGRSLALWNQRGCDPHRDLDKAVRLAQDRRGLIRANLLEAGSFFFDTREYDQLVAKLRRELGDA